MINFYRFFKRNEGSATVEFVVMLPFLLAMIGFAGGYAEVVSQREMLESATFDAGRLLSRAHPKSFDGAIDASGNPVPEPHQHFLDEAQAIVAERMSIPARNVVVTAEFNLISTAVPLSTEFYALTVTTQAEFTSPALRLLALFGIRPNGSDQYYQMTAGTSFRYIPPTMVTDSCDAAQQIEGCG